MYIQITTRCNMTCAHCCFSATNKGVDMSHEVFMAALIMATELGHLITIGGGEPTCHKHFFDFLDKSMEFYNQGKIEMSPLVITNGKLAGKARKLLKYVEEERPVTVELSQDEFHDDISWDVREAFQQHQRNTERARMAYRYNTSSSFNDGRGAGVRTVLNLIPVGRAKEVARGYEVSATQKCCCEDLLVDPEGLIWSCGCKHTLLGSVFDSAETFAGFDMETAHTGGGLPARTREEILGKELLAA